MRLDESSIYIDLKKLRNTLYQCQFLMDKSARIIYGTPIMKACGDTIAAFIISFESKEDKDHYCKLMYGHWMVLKTDIEFVVQQNIIHFAKRKPKTKKQAEDWSKEDSVFTAKVELFSLIARIDEGIGKWFGSRKGKTIIG